MICSQEGWSYNIHPPGEKGMKASLLTNFPSLSRKWPGLKRLDSSHSLSLYRTDSKGQKGPT